MGTPYQSVCQGAGIIVACRLHMKMSSVDLIVERNAEIDPLDLASSF